MGEKGEEKKEKEKRKDAEERRRGRKVQIGREIQDLTPSCRARGDEIKPLIGSVIW